MYTTKEEVGDPGYIQKDAVYVVQYCIISLIISDRTIHFRQLGMCRNRNVVKLSIKCIISNYFCAADYLRLQPFSLINKFIFRENTPISQIVCRLWDITISYSREKFLPGLCR